MDVHKVRPREGWALILDDQRKTETHGGIIIPVETGAEKVTEGSGTVIAVGNGEKNAAAGLEKGIRVVYRSFLKYAHKLEAELPDDKGEPQTEKWKNGEEKRYFLINTDDILAVMAPGVEVGVFSGRPQIPGGDR